MKKILISCTYYLPNISGVTVYVDILAKKLAQKGHKVSILTCRYKNNLTKDKEIDGMKIHRSKKLFSVGKGVFMPMFWWNSLRHVRSNEIIIANLPQLESIWLGIWSKIFGKKFVIIHHCEFNFTGRLVNILTSLVSYPIHLLTYAMADKIVSYTKDYADTSIFLKYFSKKIVYILPPVVLGKEKIVGFVGRIAWEKGIDHLVEVVSKIDKVKLILVGPYKQVVGDNSFSKLKKLIDGNKNVILWGPVDHSDLVNFYKIFDCLVLPSTNNLETFGIVQAEAMISGCPVVASDLPGVRMPIRMTGLGEITKIGDGADLAKKIKEVTKTKYDKNMFDKARGIFGIEKFIEAWQKCIN